MEEFFRSGGKFFPLREVPIMKRDAIEENHFYVRNCSNVQASDVFKRNNQHTISFILLVNLHVISPMWPL